MLELSLPTSRGLRALGHRATHIVAAVLAAAPLARWSPAQVTWRQRTMEGMFAPAMVFDVARGRTLLFGKVASGAALTAVWDGRDWVPLSPATSPSPRIEHAMAYDVVRGRVVLFGGTDGQGTYFDDTWEWDGTNWTQRAPANRPSVRSQHMMAYDPQRLRVVL